MPIYIRPSNWLKISSLSVVLPPTKNIHYDRGKTSGARMWHDKQGRTFRLAPYELISANGKTCRANSHLRLCRVSDSSFDSIRSRAPPQTVQQVFFFSSSDGKTTAACEREPTKATDFSPTSDGGRRNNSCKIKGSQSFRASVSGTNNSENQIVKLGQFVTVWTHNDLQDKKKRKKKRCLNSY